MKDKILKIILIKNKQEYTLVKFLSYNDNQIVYVNNKNNTYTII